MLLKFATEVIECNNPLEVLEKSGHACDWCGFAAMRGMSAYLDDTDPKTACSVCLAARHAGISQPKRFKIIWAPEISQPQLSHLGRSIAYVRSLMGFEGHSENNKRAANPLYRQHYVPTGKVTKLDKRLFEELSARGDAINHLFQEHFDLDVRSGLDRLPYPMAAELLVGLRMLPLAFPKSEILAWKNDDSSFNGMGLDTLEDANWFVHHLGLTSVGIQNSN